MNMTYKVHTLSSLLSVLSSGQFHLLFFLLTVIMGIMNG